jgi:FKBP-type peptidyl-prolyl cis-trans isomerase FkpA
MEVPHVRSADPRFRSLALAAAAAGVAGMLVLAGCSSAPSQTAAPEGTTQGATTQEATQPPATAEGGESAVGGGAGAAQATKLVVVDVKKGTGAEAKTGDTVTVNYTGWLTNGTKFDTSVGKAPFTFHLGAGEVIPGWDQGVAGMKVGGVRKLTIPPDLGYGAQGAGGVIPPNATLVFQVELLKVGQ